MSDNHGHTPEKKADTSSKSPKDYIVNGIYILILLIIIFSAKSWWKEHEKKEAEKINLEAEIVVYEDVPRAGKVLKYKGPTPYVFQVRYRTEIRPNQCGKIIQVDCHRWSTPFILHMPCNITGWNINEMPETQQWDRLTVTTVASQ